MRAPIVAGISIFFSFHLAGLTQNTYGDSEVTYGMFFFMGTLMMIYYNYEKVSQHYINEKK